MGQTFRVASILQSAVAFVRGAYGAIILAAAAISDPLQWPKAFGLMSGVYTWPMEVWERQLLFAALAFLWLFVWFHQKRVAFEDRRPPDPNMPLHHVLRWIARDSVWASKYRWPEEEWVQRVAAELLSKWYLGRFEMMGVERSGPSGAINYLPPAMKGSTEFEVHKLCTSEPPFHMWSLEAKGSDGMPRRFFQVRLDRREVTEVWPRRSLLNRLRRNSPVERTGDYKEIFRQQDEWYSKNYEHVPPTPLAWIVG